MFHIYNRFVVFLVLSVTVQWFPLTDTEEMTDVNIEFSTDGNLNYCDPTEHNRTCCYDNEFQCGNGKCIDLSFVCNSVTNGRGMYRYNLHSMECIDGSDEYGCLNIPCDIRRDKCDHICTDYPKNMSRCSCYKGYRLTVSNKCEDINECAIGVHSCSHACENLNGSFSCMCNKGFTKSESKTSFTSKPPKPTAEFCQPEDENILVMYNNGSWIYFYNVKTQYIFPFIQSGLVDSLDYDPLQDIIYWANRTAMCRSYIPGAKDGYVTVGHPQTLQTPQFENINERRLFSLDWTTDNIYWVKSNSLDNSKSDIIVSKINSSRILTILYKIPLITSFVVDPPIGKYFWISNSDQPTIGQYAPFATYLVENYVHEHIPPYLNLKNQDSRSLVVDHFSDGRIYWIDYKSQTIYGRHKWRSNTIDEVYKIPKSKASVAMDVFNGDIYWLTYATDEIMRTDKFGKQKAQVLIKFDQKPSSNVLKIYHSSKYDKEINYGGLSCKNSTNICFYNYVYNNLFYGCPDGVEKITEENSCNMTKESFPDDPLDCNCNDLIKICNPQSPYNHCDCDQHYRCSNVTNSNHKIELKPISKPTLYIIIVFVIMMTVIFALSCFKK